jgi:hypothetical protein
MPHTARISFIPMESGFQDDKACSLSSRVETGKKRAPFLAGLFVFLDGLYRSYKSMFFFKLRIAK